MHKFDVSNMILGQKNAQKVDFGKAVSPILWFFVLNHSSDFTIHGLFFPPKNSELQGPPVFSFNQVPPYFHLNSRDEFDSKMILTL